MKIARLTHVLAIFLFLGEAELALAQGISSGPDVIVGNLHQIQKWGTVGGITGYSIGTVSCNIGDAVLPWIAKTNEHPVIAQHLYRLKDGKLEQLGISWLKHGFGALTENLCNVCIDPGTSDALGIGCSDPYTASLNGNQGGFFGIAGLGPRSEVNPVTGDYPFPYGTSGQTGDDIYKRLQVRNADLDPAQNVGARYFVEGHYVTPDDSLAGNNNNNASYREISVGGLTGGGYDLSLMSSTMREKPALLAWSDIDPAVTIGTVDVVDDGRMMLGSKATDLGGGMWRYEYAVYNMNSDRSCGSFSLTVPSSASIMNTGFHDVDHHSGEPFDGTDWTVSLPESANGSLIFSTLNYEQNQNANALRWGTLYNIRFDIDVGPVSGTATLGLFAPGIPDTVEVAGVVPKPVNLSDVLAGTVNGGAGPITDILFLNGSPGTGPNREVRIGLGESLALDLDLPPAGSGNACSILWAWAAVPSESTITPLGFDLGFSSLPSPLGLPATPQPVRIANTFPNRFDILLGVERWPGPPTRKSPSRLINLPSGVSFPLTAFFQGLIEDPGSPNGLAAVTNGLTLIVE